MAKKAKSGASFKVQILVIAAIVMGAVFLPSTTLLFVGMMPTVVAAFVDRSKRKTKVVTVGAMNIAGCAPFLLELWKGGSSMDRAFDIIANPMAIVVMYSAASIGYLIDWAVSGLVANMLYQKGLSRKKSIRQRQDELIARWGKEVSGELALDEYGFPIEMQAKSKK